MLDNQDNLKRWQKAATKYVSELRNDRVRLIYEPAVDELLGDVSGKRILDAGCGEGYYSRRLATRGAIVTGIDGSEALLRIAREKSGERIRYLNADLTKHLKIRKGKFEGILANMVLMDLPSIDVALSEFARILVLDGFLVVSIVHPSFFWYDWVTDENNNKLYKPISDYLHEKVEELKFWGKTLHYHRPLSYYFNHLEAAGFFIESLREPSPTKQMLKKWPEWEFHTRIPSFMVIRAIVKSDDQR